MKNQILLSVIIPVYNTEKYIARCVDSIIHQHVNDLELIIVNDASSDKSMTIINQYVDQYKNIKCIDLDSNQGVGNARNIGLQNSTGKYVGFVDSDDWIDLKMYRSMIDLLESNDAEIAVCGIKNEYSNSKSSSFRYSYSEQNILSNRYALRILSKSIDIDISLSPIVCNKLYRHSFLKKHSLHFLVDSFNEDDIFTFFSFLHAEKILLVPGVNYHYYQRFDSITHTFGKKHIDDLFDAFSIAKKYLIENNLYISYRDEYSSFFEKCFSFMLSGMFKSEQNIIVQKKYLQYILEKYQEKFSLASFISYLDTIRIKKFFNL